MTLTNGTWKTRAQSSLFALRWKLIPEVHGMTLIMCAKEKVHKMPVTAQTKMQKKSSPKALKNVAANAPAMRH